MASIFTLRHGRVNFTLTSENIVLNNIITSKRVEDGSTREDHTQTEPDILEITGILSGTRVDVSNDEIRIRQMRNTLLNVAYTGKKTFPSGVIKSVTFTDPAPGSPNVAFNMVIQTIRVVETETVDIDVNELSIPDLKRSTSRGQQAQSTFNINNAQSLLDRVKIDSYERKFRITGREEQLLPPLS